MGAAGPASFLSGFGKALTGQILQRRERQREDTRLEEERKARSLSAYMPVALELYRDSGDSSYLDNLLTNFDPEYAKRFKKDGSPFTALGPILQSQAQPATQVANQLPAQNEPIPTTVEAKPTLPSTQQAGTQMTRPTLFGVPIPTQPERQQRAAAAKIEGAEGDIDAKLAMARRLVATGAATSLQDALDQLGLHRSATGGFTLSPGEVRYDPSGKELARGADKPVTSASGDFTLGPNQVRFDEQGKVIARGETAPEEDVSAQARLVIRNPSILKELTPSRRGEILGVIAKNPQLMQQYETKRMEPIRAQATTIEDALGKLLVFDDKGVPVGLTKGARQIYGEYTPPLVRDFIPTAASADANAALAQITGQQILTMLGDMKAQSQTGATGFGQLSLNELDVLTSAATQLRGRLSEPTALAQLKALYEKVHKIGLPSAGEAGAAPGADTGAGAGGATGAPTGAITLESPVYIGADGRPSYTAPAAR